MKSKQKRSSLYLNETIELIVLQPPAKKSKVQKFRVPRCKKESLENRIEATHKILYT